MRNPWPQDIGLGFPFTASGASSVLAGIVCAELPQPDRDRFVNKAGAFGFGGGLLLYALALLVQLSSAL